MSGTQENALFDSLPYYDQDFELHPLLREKVDAEIAKELKRSPKPPNPPPITLFEKHPLLAAELARIESHTQIPLLDTIRYQLPAPKANSSEEEWSKALKNAKAQLEHQRIRHANLALLQTYGSNAWKVHNYLLEASVTQMEKAAEQFKELTIELNRERKNNQTKLGNQLTTLETRWTELISNVLQIELANVALQAEVEQLRSRESELATAV